MQNKYTWDETAPKESIEEIASFIAKEYFTFTNGTIISNEKLQYMLFFCIRDASAMVNHPIVNEIFEIYNVIYIKINAKISDISVLLKKEPTIIDPFVKMAIRAVLPNYAIYDTWVLERMYCDMAEFTLGKYVNINEKYKFTFKDMWEYTEANPPYNYYDED